jgi:hypothetical protein
MEIDCTRTIITLRTLSQSQTPSTPARQEANNRRKKTPHEKPGIYATPRPQISALTNKGISVLANCHWLKLMNRI